MIYVTHDQVEAMTMGDRIVVMKDGIIQQIDAPLTLYNNPVNLFVAGFLGSPPMNFIHGKLHASGDCVIFKENDGGTIELSFTDRPELKPFAGRDVVAGIRAENIVYVHGVDKPSRPRFQGVVDVIEPMGAETYFYVQTGAHTIISRNEGSVDHSETGHRLQFEIDLDRVHIFDPSTTARIAK